MIFVDLQLVDENPSWALVLGAYRALEVAAAEARAIERKKAKAAQAAAEANGDVDDEPAELPEESTDDSWFSRLFEIEGVETEELSEIHGQLIAHGFLNFDLSGRDGLVYRLTNLGKRAAIAPGDRVADDDEDDSQDEELAEAA